MATLTYNPEEPQAEEFTEEEQADIAVGEQLEQQEQALLAGKFKDAEDLEKAYIELQSKLGKPQEEQQPVTMQDASALTPQDQLNINLRNKKVQRRMRKKIRQQDKRNEAKMMALASSHITIYTYVTSFRHRLLKLAPLTTTNEISTNAPSSKRNEIRKF